MQGNTSKGGRTEFFEALGCTHVLNKEEGNSREGVGKRSKG